MTTSPVEKKPFSALVAFTFLAEDMDAASRQLEQVDDFADTLGMNGEAVVIRQMEPEDVIPGSPLDTALRSLPSKAEAPDAF